MKRKLAAMLNDAKRITPDKIGEAKKAIEAFKKMAPSNQGYETPGAC